MADHVVPAMVGLRGAKPLNATTSTREAAPATADRCPGPKARTDRITAQSIPAHSSNAPRRTRSTGAGTQQRG